MIIESYIWKEELNKELKSFEKFLKDFDILNEDEKYQDKYNLKIEKFFFVTSFIIRKLIEAKKITDFLVKEKLHCIGYEKIYRLPRLLDYYGHSCDIEKNYCLDKPLNFTISLQDICNLFIHSYVFQGCFNKNRFDGIFINSINTKNKICYYITYQQYKKIIVDVCNDFVNEVIMRFNAEKNITEVINLK